MSITPSNYQLKVALGIPFSGRYVPPEWSMALNKLIYPMNCRHAAIYVNCSRHEPKLSREEAREEIVSVANRLKAEYLLFLDDDTEPPENAVISLIQQLDSHPDFSICAGIYPRRGTGEPMVFINRNLGPHWRWRVGQVFECAEIGTGCMLIRLSLFNTLPKPWFRDLNTLEEELEAGVLTSTDIDLNTTRGAMTDDIFFCRKATDAHHRILAHGGVICRHWGRNGDYYEIPADSFPYQNPHKDLDPRIHSAMAINGWMDPLELQWLADQASKHTNIIELGSWRGRSSRCLAENTKGHLTCVDPWDASNWLVATQYPDKQPEPDFIWDEFRMNMIGLDNVGAMRMSSLEASTQIPAGLKFDMIFIDAEHDYANVTADINAWRQHLAPGGLLCGHDYDESWPDVVKAVDELLPASQRVPKTNIWFWQADTPEKSIADEESLKDAVSRA